MAIRDVLARLIGGRRTLIYGIRGARAQVLGMGPTELYRKQPALRAVVSFLADNVAGVPLKCYVRSADDDRPRDTTSDLALLVNRPSPGMTTHELVRALTSDYLIYGSSLCAVLPDRDAPSGWSMRHIPWSWVLSRETENGFDPSTYTICNPYTGGRVELDAADCILFSQYDPAGTLDATSPIEALREVLSEQVSAWNFRNSVWRNGGRVSAYLYRPRDTPWGDGARDRFAKSWKAKFSGEEGTDTGGTPLLEDGMELRTVQFNAREAEWAEATRLTREDVAAVYHVNPSLIWHSDGQTYASAKDNARALYADTLSPIMDMIEERLNGFLVPMLGLDPAGHYVEFDLSAKLAASFEEQASVLQSSTGAPWLTRNEARARMNLPAVDGGDDLIVPLNVTEGGLASPNDTDPTVERYNGAPPPQAKGAEPDATRVDGDGADQLVLRPTVRIKAREIDPAGLKDVLRRFYERQAASMGNHVSGGGGVYDDRKRWVRELAKDLSEVLDRPFNDSAAEAALALGMELSDIDRDKLARTLRQICEVRADDIVQSTLTRLLKDLGELDEWTPDAVTACVRESYSRHMEQRISVNSQSLASMVSHAGTVEGARQAQPSCMKEWVTSRHHTRDSHAKMDGQRVGISERFSNGARWPHDLNLSAEDSCNCRCRIEIVSGEGRASGGHLKEVRREERRLQKGVNSSWQDFKTDEREPHYQSTVGEYIRSFSKDGNITARYRAKPKGKEIQAARILADSGYRVEFLAENGKGKHPDVSLDGLISDFKRIEAFNPDAVYKEIKRGVAQGAEQVVIDLAYDRVKLADALRKAEKAVHNGIIAKGRVIIIDWHGELHSV